MAGEFEPRSHVNGNMLRQFVGQNISIMLYVEDKAGSTITTTSTDDHKITVSLTDSEKVSKGNWIEAIGRPAGPNAIRAKEAIVFDKENIEFDKEAYNMMVQFMNNCKEIYRSG